jgi:hypothetical protein
MQKLLSGFAFAAALVTLQTGIANAAMSCSASNKPVLFDTKTKTYYTYPAATSEAQRQKNIAMAKQAMAKDPNLKAMCTDAAIKHGGVPAKQAGFGGINAVPKPVPTGPPAHTN